MIEVAVIPAALSAGKDSAVPGIGIKDEGQGPRDVEREMKPQTENGHMDF